VARLDWEKAQARETGRSGKRAEKIPSTQRKRTKRWKLVQESPWGGVCGKCGGKIAIGAPMWERSGGVERRHGNCYRPRAS
jgi:hypothetical protein